MKDIFGRIVAVILWIASIVLAIKGEKLGLIFLVCLHLCETVLVGFRTGIKYGKGILETIVCCMTWGYLWWLPLHKRMRHDELTEADYVEDGLEPWREKE